MTIEIKTSTLEPVRHTFANLERRFGDKPASRYQEATYDLQAETNFHYRPLWQPDKELNDRSRTAIVMADWYAFRDPRQFYYGTYVQQRAKMQDVAESNYSFFDKRNSAEYLPADVRSSLIQHLIPLRHAEHTANLNNIYGSAYGYGTAITQALLFNGMDRLGIAQYLSRIGLMLDNNSGEALEQAKAMWMDDPMWQGLRALCETSLTVTDWFELFVAQDLVMDTLMYDLFYHQYDDWLGHNGGRDIGMLTEFMREWNRDNSRWVDSVIKIAAAESDSNKALLSQWFGGWRGRVAEALAPVVNVLCGGNASLENALAELDNRAARLGLL